MPLAVDAIHRVLDKIFVERFGALAGVSAEFRFSRTPLTFADGDFAIAGRPDAATSTALAAERLAIVADGVPLLCADGRSVELGPRSISALYRDHLVRAAVPQLGAPGETATAYGTRVEELHRIRADALQRLEATRAASLLHTGWFRPVHATPATWWNRADDQVWTEQRLEIDGGFGRSTRAPAGPASPIGTAVSIRFACCVVHFTRTWLSNELLENTTWYIPGERRGRFSANDGLGLPALPVGFVAIQRLRIAAPWTPEEVSDLAQLVQLGPFVLDTTVGGGAIGYDGIQIIGWLLQQVSTLPPGDDAPLFGGTSELLAANQRTVLPPDGLPPPPPARGEQPIPCVARVDSAGCRAVAMRGTPAVVFVSAVWAGHSRQMERIVESLAREHRDTVVFVELPFEAIEGMPVVRELRLKAVPSFLLMDRGREVARLVGMVPEALIRSVQELRRGTLGSIRKLPGRRRAPIQQWLDVEDLAFVPGMAAQRRTAPLWGVPQLDRSSFEAAIRHRDTLVFFSDPASRVLEPLAQAVSALYAPRFQTSEIQFFADRDFTRQLKIELPETFALYRHGTEVARVTRPSSRGDLMKRLGVS
jgi:Thioredoxin